MASSLLYPNFFVCIGGHNLSCKQKGHFEKKNRHKILIAGGGIAGLVFALAAKRKGFDAVVFEKDLTAVRGEGRERGPIQLLSSALSLLESIDKDAAAEIIKAGYAIGDMDNGIVDGITSEWLIKFDLLDPLKLNGMPVTQMICRVDLQRILLTAVGEDTVINNSKVVNFSIDVNKVTVFLENGEQHEGNVLVGADGVRSMVRARLFGHQGLNYSNFMCYAGVAEFHPLHFSNFGYKIFVGPNQYFVAANIGQGKMQWYAFVREPCSNSCDSPTDIKNMLLERFVGWADKVLTIIFAISERMIIQRPIFDTDMLTTWGRGRVLLIGDAAHAILPNFGQGGSMAIEMVGFLHGTQDCYWLVVELHKLVERDPMSEIPTSKLALAFKRFEKKRMVRIWIVHSVCRLATAMTSLYHTYFDLTLFNVSARVKHPAVVVSKTLLQLAVPKFMAWVVTGRQ